ncbi:MAG TPA: TadE family protein [Candidatus Limnocylindria bacterium]|nr:TadE family protein [Candidatus Limnocylindria bacterium]
MSRTDRRPRWRSRSDHPRGQAMVEFAFAFVIFFGLLMGILDLGRAVYQWNGVSQAAREIARATSVHPGVPLGTSDETADVVDGQQDIFPDMRVPEFECRDLSGADATTPTGACLPGNFVNVRVTADFEPVTPIFNLIPLTLTSSSSVQIP